MFILWALVQSKLSPGASRKHRHPPPAAAAATFLQEKTLSRTLLMGEGQKEERNNHYSCRFSVGLCFPVDSWGNNEERRHNHRVNTTTNKKERLVEMAVPLHWRLCNEQHRTQPVNRRDGSCLLAALADRVHHCPPAGSGSELHLFHRNSDLIKSKDLTCIFNPNFFKITLD